jgi:restriction system protein
MGPYIPKWNELFGPTVRALKALGGSATIQEIVDKVIELEDFSPEQLAVLHGDSGKSEIEYRLAWSRTNLKNLGAVTNSARGVWALTEYGKNADQAELVERDREWRKKLAAARAAVVDDQDQGDAESDVDWKSQLLQRLQILTPDAFERLAQRLLREAGFTKVTVTGRSGDGGIDGVGVYKVSLMTFPTFFQCKRYRGAVGPGVVRDFRGAMAGRGDKGLLLTTGSFTKDAKIEATRDGAPPIELIDGDELCDLLKTYDLGVLTRQRVEEDVSVVNEFFDEL